MPNLQKKKSGISLLIPFAIIALVFGLLIWKKVHNSQEVRPVPAVNEPAAIRKGVLFFVAGGNRLAREARELESCGDTADCLKDLLEELFSGPVGDLDVAIPDAALLNDLQIRGDTALVDVSSAFASDLTGGSSAEMLAVYSIIDTVCVNYPQIARVKISIDGNDRTVLRHLDLSEPLTPDFSLEEKLPQPESSVPAAAPTPVVKKGQP